MTAVPATAPAPTPPLTRGRSWRGPWRPPYVLAAVTVGYLVWSLAPVLLAVLFSFNSGRSRSTWQGFSMRWYYADPTLSVLHDESLRRALTHTLTLGLLTTLVAVPLGVAFALGLDRWHGRLPASANFTMLLSFVIPEIVLAVGLFYMITLLATPFVLGTTAQVVGLVTFQLSYPVVIVRARLATIGPQYEEAARDLGASAFGAMRRVLLPMLMPAIFTSAVLVFADVLDDFVIVRYLSSDAFTETTSIKIYNTARGAPTPALNAVATLMLVASFVVVLLGWLAVRRFGRGQEEPGSLGAFAGQV
ncbi:ABC transporter permease [Kineosporia sp. R_H_3]|uniref:ABC transporter permease n=1 Tax=Kineosporia sp. R_H_3 TaxID=1961848 RepID=UPI000B4B87C7|nr:ABC transporter permease [Kineosporia sp. R_H_3]